MRSMAPGSGSGSPAAAARTSSADSTSRRMVDWSRVGQDRVHDGLALAVLGLDLVALALEGLHGGVGAAEVDVALQGDAAGLNHVAVLELLDDLLGRGDAEVAHGRVHGLGVELVLVEDALLELVEVEEAAAVALGVLGAVDPPPGAEGGGAERDEVREPEDREGDEEGADARREAGDGAAEDELVAAEVGELGLGAELLLELLALLADARRGPRRGGSRPRGTCAGGSRGPRRC